jgi:hypothetical protein
LWSQGASVALSGDGNTAIVGGPSDDKTTGATWVFVRSGGVWSQQGDKLVGTGAYRADESGVPLGQGMSIALSADGDTAIVGGWGAEGSWVLTRSGGVWSQQGKQLVRPQPWYLVAARREARRLWCRGRRPPRHVRRAVRRRQYRPHWWPE